MIQKLLLTTAIIFLLLSNGCAKKRATLSNANGVHNPGEYDRENRRYGNDDVSKETKVAGETVTIDENKNSNSNASTNKNKDSSTNNNNVNSRNVNDLKDQSDEKSANASTWNSSKDGFKSIYFAYDNYGLSSNMRERMGLNSEIASRVMGKIKIEGNCDEFGTDEYNFALGLKRAKAVKTNLLASGIPSSKIILVSLGESNPVCSDFTHNCYTKNRRVDLKIVR